MVWFSSGILVSSTNKIDRHDIAEILLKMALSTINKTRFSGKVNQASRSVHMLQKCPIRKELYIEKMQHSDWTILEYKYKNRTEKFYDCEARNL